jgi:tetratricopeptide (TPR) repeat protein
MRIGSSPFLDPPQRRDRAGGRWLSRLWMHMVDAPETLLKRAREFRTRGELARAVDILAGAIKADAHADWAYAELIPLLFHHGRRAEAERLARKALTANPRSPLAHEHFGTILSELNDLPAGEWHFRRSLALGGERASALANLAINLMNQGRLEEAEVLFADADRLAPDELLTLGHWSKLYEIRGDFARAAELLDRAQAGRSPRDVDLLRAQLLSRAGRDAEALAIIESAPALNGDGQLQRGRLYDRLGRYDEAWRDFVEGKAKLAAQGGGLRYQAEAVETFFGGLARFFVKDTFELLPRAPARSDVPQPIFVMGFPRSGTTLIEQVLASHPSVRAGGELAFAAELRKLANHLFPGPEAFPANLAQAFTADHRYAATVFRDYYLARAAAAGLLEPDKAWFVDKMPFNEVWLPLITMAFPDARVVRVVRHPLDVCVSVMSNNLTHGFNCGYRIEDTVHHFAAVFDLVEHYRRELGHGEYVLRYESFVANQVDETRRLLAYVGLPFDEACLRFNENRRHARTPSYAQVIEPLNDRSIARHRHYARQLAPFLPRLAPIMAAHDHRV